MPYVPKSGSLFGRAETAALMAMLGRSASIKSLEAVIIMGSASSSDLKYYMLGLDPEDNYKDVGKLWLAIKMSGIKPTKLAELTSLSRTAWFKAIKRNSLPKKLTDKEINILAQAVGCTFDPITRKIKYDHPVRYKRGVKYDGEELHKELVKHASQKYLSTRS